MMLKTPKGQFTGVLFNAEDVVNQTDDDTSFMMGYTRAQVIHYVRTTRNWSLVGTL